MSARFGTIGRRLTTGDALPEWFSAAVYSLVVWCTTAGITALLLLVKNIYSPVLCSLAALAFTAAAFPFRPRRAEGARSAHGPAVAAVAIALGLLAFASVSHSEHLFADRDPSVYVNTGRSIARTHLIRPDVPQSPFGDTTVFTQRSSGFVVAGHRLISNFLDFLPALLALGWAAGGDTGMLVVPAILGALGLLVLYALASTIVGPRWALVAPALLTLAPLQSWFARDAYAELPVELLALGGLWLFIEARRRGSPTSGAIAGVVLGTITFARIDALGILLAIPAALAVEYLRTEKLEPPMRRLRRGAIFSFAIALGATTWLGLRVSHRLSPGYLVNLHKDLHQLEIGFVIGIAAALGILLVHWVRAGIGHRIAQHNIVVGVGAAMVLGLAVYAYHWRPRSGAPPTLAGGAPRTTFNAFFLSSSFRWFGWYFGVFTLAFVVIGFIVLGVRAARADSPAFLLLAAAAPMTLLYIARPSISPDNLWAMRRYLPIVLPGMAIAASAAAIGSTTAVGARWPRARIPTAMVVVAAMLIPAAIAGRPFVDAQMQGGALAAVHTICDAAGADAAIAVEPYGLLALELPQTLRGFCGVPAAGLNDHTAVPLAGFAARWVARGRQLYVASGDQATVLATAPHAVEVAHVVVADAREPERTLGRRPNRYAPRPVEVWLYRVDPA